MATPKYKKLTLNKETLRAMNRSEVMIAGGAAPAGKAFMPNPGGKMSPFSNPHPSICCASSSTSVELG
jgi:hypothetical protein